MAKKPNTVRQQEEDVIAAARALRGKKGRKIGERSLVVDVPGHPVAAPCAIEHCKYFELHDALNVIYTAVRGDEKSEWWTLRKYLDDHFVFNDDLQDGPRLIEAVCKHALHIK
jgi:hypothetical protein